MIILLSNATAQNTAQNTAQAQNTLIKGIVTSDNQPLADVALQIDSDQKQYQVKSSVNGTFQLEVLSGTYKITASKSGYQSQSLKLSAKAKEVSVKIKMLANESSPADGKKEVATKDTKSKATKKAKRKKINNEESYGLVGFSASGSGSGGGGVGVGLGGLRGLQTVGGGAGVAYGYGAGVAYGASGRGGKSGYGRGSKGGQFMSSTLTAMPNENEFASHSENDFFEAKASPLSTFSIDVDTASYALIRSYLDQKAKPDVDSVRIEELINYFDYQYSAPTAQDQHPFKVYTELSMAPWRPKHKLLHIGLQGLKIDTNHLPQNNLVFLIDVSGSMSYENKLPLLKQAFSLLVENLTEKDKVSIVVYAGAAGLVLAPTPASDKAKIINALSALEAGGSTAGGQGIELAYQIALQNKIEGGNNRVILATDGDFNVGVNSEGDLLRLIEAKRKSGIFLTVLGFGMGNYKDNKMSILAEKGNGNQAYIDSIAEARKVLVEEMGGTLVTIAKDVKIQVEFNPSKVAKYRLIGYESRILANQDFNNDQKDAGELGAGHSVTALYEIEPVLENQNQNQKNQEDELKYQSPRENKPSEEWVNLKLRYKKANEDQSILLEHTHQGEIDWDHSSADFKFASAVAMFGMLLKNSPHVGEGNYELVRKIASQSLNENSYRMDFLEIVKKAMLIK